jgi:hypothetical protein
MSYATPDVDAVTGAAVDAALERAGATIASDAAKGFP